LEAKVKDMNKVLKRVAREAGVRFEDPGQELLMGRQIDESLFVDGLHPTEVGYECVASYYR
jgi:hypothetical protein